MLSFNHHSINLKNNFFKKSVKKIDYAILSAMNEELKYVHSKFLKCKHEKISISNLEFTVYEYEEHNILVTATGIGTTFAASITTLIYHLFSPDYILFVGTAGGIQSELKIRDVVIVEQAFEAEIQEIFTTLKNTPFESCLTHPILSKKFPSKYFADIELLTIARKINLPNITLRSGTGVSSNTFPAPKELFEKIKKECPLIIDMETSAFYQVGWLLQARVMAIRGISNLLNSDGSDDNVQTSDVKTRIPDKPRSCHASMFLAGIKSIL